MDNSIVLRINPEITVTANPQGLLFATVGGWTVTMRAADAADYAADLHSRNNPDKGFFKHPSGYAVGLDGMYVLSHNGAKISLSGDEFKSLLDFIHQCKEYWQ